MVSWCVEESLILTTIWGRFLNLHTRFWRAPSDRARRRVQVTWPREVDILPQPWTKSNQYLSRIVRSLIPTCPISRSTRNNQIDALRVPSVSRLLAVSRRLILLALLHAMSHPTKTNEEQSPSPEGVHNTGSIAIDGEGGIPYIERVMGPAREGEGKS